MAVQRAVCSAGLLVAERAGPRAFEWAEDWAVESVAKMAAYWAVPWVFQKAGPWAY